MKNYNDEYFYLRRIGERYPLIDYIGYDTELYKRMALDITEKRMVRFGDPVPHKPLLGDLHSLKVHAPVISERLKNVLEGLNLRDMQFLPAIIRDNRDDEHEGFFIIHIYNLVRCMDKEKSKWRPSPWNEGDAIGVDKLVLDNEVLDAIPLEERLVFRLGELDTHALYHQSVIEKILEIEPKGLTVYRLSGYDSSLPFKQEYLANSSFDFDVENLSKMDREERKEAMRQLMQARRKK